MKMKRKKKVLQVPKLESLKQINPNAAGVDVGASELYVCVPEDRDPRPVRVFQTFTSDLHEIAAWLKRWRVTSVAMESTGIYWIPLYEVLEEAGFEVKLVNAREAKNMPGRKSDILDCQWIQQLHSYGLLTASFRPPKDIVALRSLVRHRDRLIVARAVHIQHMQKPLPPSKKQQKKPRKDAPTFDLRSRLYEMAGVDLTAIDGCNAATIQVVLSETGVDMEPWRTCGHFTSWMCLAPHNDISGGKVLRSRAKKTKNRANTALRLAAQALTHSDSWLGAYYRRQRARLGAPKAIIATAHKIARIIYYMLKYQREFVDLGANHYEAQYRKRQINSLTKKAASLGLLLVPAKA